VTKKLKWAIKRQIPGYAFLLPGFLFMAVYMGYPIFRSLYLSFTRYNFAFDDQPRLAGFVNYAKLFTDSFFLAALKNTTVFTLIFFPVVLVIALVLAMLLENGVKGSGIFRTCIFVPVVVPLSLTGIIFQWILNRNYGLLNWFLADVLQMGHLAKDWLGDPFWAMASIILVSFWKNIGILMIMFMAGLQAISNEMIEAACVDGASVMQRIFRIILPNLKESYIVCGIWAIIQAIKVFEQPFVTWINAFKYFEMGYASSVAYFMGVVILTLSVLNMYINRSDDAKVVKK
jgi:ABC-type sugar transport system permease subunit